MPSKPYDNLQHTTFWNAIRRIRLGKGMTQNMVAERVRESADAPWMSRVESGQKDITLRTAIKIAEALGEQLRIGDYIIVGDD